MESQTAKAPMGVTRARLIVAWMAAPSAVYVLLSLAHAAFVERLLTLDIGFGRTLAFWVGSAMCGLALWGFLPPIGAGWYARRGAMVAAAAFSAIGLVVSLGYAVAWSWRRWNPSVGWPLLISVAVVLAVTLATLWFASRADREPSGS